MKIILLFIFLNIAFVATAQYLVKGVITDSSSKSIRAATVTVRQHESSAIMAFCIADEKGCYQISLPGPLDSLLIEVGALGYATVRCRIPETGGQNFEKSFILASATIVLKEVVVKAQIPKVNSSNDTVTFRADAYRDNTEKVAEDLLKKIPGVDVAQDGSISVQGKRIDRILIDGDDIFNRNYTLVTKNLSADLIQKVQIINRYTDKPLLKGLMNSENKVLNLILKKTGEKVIFGNITVGAGNDNKYDLATNLICFYKKMKVYAFGNYNSIGDDPLPEISNNVELEESINSQDAGEITGKKIIEAIRNPPGDFERKRMNFNEAKLSSVSFINKPNDKIQIKGLVYVFGDKNDIRENNVSRYTIPDSIINFTDVSNARQIPGKMNGQLNFRYTPTSTEQLDYTFTSRYDKMRTNAAMTSNGALFINSGNDRSLLQRHQLCYMRKSNEKNLVSVDADYYSVDRSQNFYVQRSPPLKFPLTDSFFQRIMHSLSYPVSLIRLSAKDIHGNANNNISLETGMVVKRQEIISSLNSFGETDQKRSISDSFENNLAAKLTNYFTTISGTKMLSGGFRIISDLTANVHLFKMVSCTHCLQYDKNVFYLTPKLSLKWGNSNSNFSIGYVYNTRSPEMTDLTTGYIMTDYRTLKKGSTLYRLSNAHVLLLNYNYASWTKQMLIYINYLQINDRGVFNNQYALSENYDIMNRVAASSRQKTSALSVGIDKFIPWIFSSLKLKSGISRTDFRNQLNNMEERKISTWNTITQLSLRTAFKGLFNFHIGSVLNYGLNKVAELNKSVSYGNSLVHNFIDLRMNMSGSWSMEMNTEQYCFRPFQRAGKSCFFMDFTIRYNKPGSKILLNLSGQNLINNKTFFIESVTDFSTQIRQIDLIPALLFFELTYRF